MLIAADPSVASVAYVLSDAREAIGFIPWMFNLPDAAPTHAAAFAQITDPQGFAAAFGPSPPPNAVTLNSAPTASALLNGTACLWPFATSQTLYALANYLRATTPSAHALPSLPLRREGPGEGQPPSTINYQPSTTSRLSSPTPAANTRTVCLTSANIRTKPPAIGSTASTTAAVTTIILPYADLLITGIIGLIPRADDVVEINPLLPNRHLGLVLPRWREIS